MIEIVKAERRHDPDIRRHRDRLQLARGPGMHRKNDFTFQPPVELAEGLEDIGEIFGVIDVLVARAVTRYTTLLLQPEPGQNVAGFNLGCEGAHCLERGISRNDYLRGVNAFAQQILAVIPIVRQQDAADMIDQDAVALFRHTAVPCPQPGFHVENLDAAMRRRKHAQTAIGISDVIRKSDALMEKVRPDALLTLGDTYSGLSVLPAAHRGIKIFHMEAGLRAWDSRMPEQRNRILIDHISSVLLPYNRYHRENLLREGIHPSKIIVTGKYHVRGNARLRTRD